MEAKSIPESTRALIDQARSLFDQALALESKGESATAETQAASAFALMAKAASAGSQQAADYRLFMEMNHRHSKGFQRSESTTHRTTQVYRSLDGREDGALACLTTTVTSDSKVRMETI